MTFRYTRPYPGDLASGRPVARGDEVDLTPQEQAANARLIDEGDLVPVRPPRRRRTRPKSTRTKRSDR